MINRRYALHDKSTNNLEVSQKARVTTLHERNFVQESKILFSANKIVLVHRTCSENFSDNLSFKTSKHALLNIVKSRRTLPSLSPVLAKSAMRFKQCFVD